MINLTALRLYGSNNWSISNESLYATVLSTVVNQINETRGQIYFPFLYSLFIFILINNLIGLVQRCLCGKKLLSKRQPQRVRFSSYSSPFSQGVRFTSHLSDYNKRAFSTCSTDKTKLNSYFITGFTGAEGCFHIPTYISISNSRIFYFGM